MSVKIHEIAKILRQKRSRLQKAGDCELSQDRNHCSSLEFVHLKPQFQLLKVKVEDEEQHMSFASLHLGLVSETFAAMIFHPKVSGAGVLR